MTLKVRRKLTAKFRPNPKFDYLNKLRKWKQQPPETDAKPPIIYAPLFVKLRMLQPDAEVFLRTFWRNTYMLKKNLSFRAEIDTYREPKNVGHLRRNLHPMRMKMEKHMKENLYLYQKIKNVKPSIEKTSAKILNRKCQQLKDYQKFKAPEEILRKYGNLMPRDFLLYKLLRPRVWFELELLHCAQSHVGRIEIELFTEAAPLVVMEFVRVCAINGTGRTYFVRLFPGLWLEGELHLGRHHRLAQEPFDYDIRALQFDAGGIVSAPAECLTDGCKYGVLSFTISSRPLPFLNGKRLAFGRIVENKVIEILQDYGTKNGKLKKQLSVTACGVYK